MFGNKLVTALATLKTMADQQSARGSSLTVVLVVVQCMRQYTENSPGCSTAMYTSVGGRRQYTTQCWKPLPCQMNLTDHTGTVTDHTGTVTDRIGTVTGRIGTVNDRIGTVTDYRYCN